jgi:histone-lysine N-methyltransferase SETMAR
MKTIFITFFDIKDTYIVHFEYTAQGQTVSQAYYYVEILKQLHEAVCWKWAGLWPNNWIIHHDNATAQKALSVTQFLAQKLITEMEHPPCSPNLAPNDFWLFPEIKCALKIWRFQDIEDIQKK